MRVPEKRYRDEWLPNLYPGRAFEGDWLRVSRSGKTLFLSEEENRQLDEVAMDAGLFERLERLGHIVTAANTARVFKELKTWFHHSFAGPSLHIVVLTKRCNLNCTYCHMNPVPIQEAGSDMSKTTANEIIRFAFESPNPHITFEFQGGEPFLNFECMKHFVEEAHRQNTAIGKDLKFTVVTNLMVASDEHLRFCADSHISVSYTLNGPADIHDSYRRTRAGAGSYEAVMRRVRYVQEVFPGLVSSFPLCVVDSRNAPCLHELVDFYFQEGFSGLAIVRLKPLGNARRSELDFSMPDFLAHYIPSLTYIAEKNRNDPTRVFTERMVPIAIQKILNETDVGFVDWRNPCGDISGAITYDFDGEILPADEARSMRAEFGLGNVTGLAYDSFVRREDSYRTMNLSLRDRDPACRECSYNPYCGVMPVLEYARGGSSVPKPHESEECLFTIALLDWVFKMVRTDPLTLFRMAGFSFDELRKVLAD